MEKRAYRRIPVKLEGEFISDDISYIVYIRNMSEYGANAIIAPLKSAKDFTSEKTHELKIRLVSGETLNLSCKGKWSSAVSFQGLTKEIGLEIIDPPLQYKEFLTTLT